MANQAPAGAGQGGGVPPYRFQTAGPTQYACAVAESHSGGLSTGVYETSHFNGIYNLNNFEVVITLHYVYF